MKPSLTRFVLVGTVIASGIAGAAPAAPYTSTQGYIIVPPQEMHRVDADPDDAEGNGSDVDFQEGAEDDDNGTRLSIMVQPDPSPVTLEQAVRVMRTTVEDGMKEEHYKVLEQGKMVLDGSKALTFTASMSVDDDDPKTPPTAYRNVLIFTLHGGKFYVLNYASPASRFAQTKKSLDASLASFHWTE